MKKKKKTFDFRFLLLFSCLLFCSNSVFAQERIKVTGTVVDSNNEPLIGVTVMAVATKDGTITDFEGNFSVVASPKTVLKFSYMGYSTKEIIVGNETTIKVTLNEDVKVLDELVVIGYGVARKKDLTGATSSLKGSEIANVPVTSAAQALSGKIAGVNVTTQSGAPGSSINILVRGGTSITQSTEPLYIVDGFQMDKGLESVDINDIESIDVMKDASSTAIYGARGSNGVVLITTKSGKKGKTEVSYNGYLSFEKLAKTLDLLNTYDYVRYQYEYQALAGGLEKWSKMFGGDFSSPDFHSGAFGRMDTEYRNREGIDWQEEVFGGTALMQNHNVSITGGTDKTRFLLSYNHTSQDGLIDKSGYTNNNIRVKLNHEISKNIRLDFGSSFKSTLLKGGGSLGGLLKMTTLQPVTGGIKYTNDQLLNTDVSDEMTVLDSQYDIYNPFVAISAITKETHNRLFTANVGIDIDILKNLTWRTAGSYAWSQERADMFDDGRTKDAKIKLGPYGSRNNGEKLSWQITNTISWREKFGLHHVNAVVGQETNYSESIKLENEYRIFPENSFGLNDVSMAENVFSYASGKNKIGMVSVFGRVMYNYDERYLLTGTLRGDGSSKFKKGNKWGLLPSASAAWRVSEESFMKNMNLVDNLKLRIGYGVTGNCDIENHAYETLYSGAKYGINNQSANTISLDDVIGNPDLVWEQTKSVNVGLDLSILKNRINLTVDYYNNKSDNLLIKNEIPVSTGYSYQFQNLAAVENRGIEFMLNTLNVKTKDFQWATDFNISFNKSKVLDLYGGSGENYFRKNYGSRIDYLVEVGKPLGQFYGYKYDGVYTTSDFTQNADGTYTLNDGVASLKGRKRETVKPGDVKYIPTAGETDDKGNPVWSTADRTVIGNAEPDFVGGINNTFTYKNFDLSVFMNFSVGGEVFNMNTQRFMGPYLPNQNSLGDMANYYRLVDPNTGKETKDLARLAELNPNQYSSDAVWSLAPFNKIAITDATDYFLEDASFLRINNITLGYNMPKQLLAKAFISRARVYFTLNNIHTFTKYKGYDPEVSATSEILTRGVDNSAYPKSKSFVVGVNLTF